MTQTIQATGKTWKLVQLVGTLGILFAVGVGFTAFFAEVGPALGGAAITAVVLAVPLHVVGRFGAWWFHG